MNTAITAAETLANDAVMHIDNKVIITLTPKQVEQALNSEPIILTEDQKFAAQLQAAAISMS